MTELIKFTGGKLTTSKSVNVSESMQKSIDQCNITARQLLPQSDIPLGVVASRRLTETEWVAIVDSPLADQANLNRVLVSSKTLQQPAGSLQKIRDLRYNGNPNVIDAKAFAIAAYSDSIKSGLVNFQSRTGRSLNAAASFVTPGNLSVVRNPGRSLVMRAATPGGGGVGTRLAGGGAGGGLGARIGRTAAEAAVRCPTGYQFGGRFSNRQLANCGQQLFDTPGNIDQPGGRATAAALRLARTLVNPPRGANARRILSAGFIGPGERPVLDATLTRMAQVPRVGAANASRSDDAIRAGVQTVAAAAGNGAFSRLIRRDGEILDSRVPVAKLASQRRNPDLTDGTIISAINNPSKIGADEVALFGAGVSSVRLVAPGGQEIRLDRVGKISSSDSQYINRQWTAIRRGLNNAESAIGLQQLAARSKGKIRYSEKFNNIDRPNDLVSIERNGIKKTVPRWVYEAYYSPNAPGRQSDEAAWKIDDVISGGGDGKASPLTVANAADARKALENNASLADIPATLRDEAIEKAKTFEAKDLGNGKTLFTGKNGERYVRSEVSSTEAFGEKLTADLQKALGLDVPEVLLGKPGSKRSVYRATPETAVPEGKLNASASLSKASAADLAQIALADFVLGRTGRNAGSIAMVSKGNSVVAIANGGDGSEILNNGKLANDKLVAAISRKPEELLASLTDGGGWAREYTQDPSLTVRRLIIENYNKMLERIAEFDWASYLARTNADGQMSIADKQHVEFMRKLLGRRAGQLRSSRKTILRILGVSE